MSIERIRELDEMRPFQPFVLHLADGRNIPVAHPEFLAYTPDGETIVVLQSGGGLKILNLSLITEIEVMVRRPAKRQR